MKKFYTEYQSITILQGVTAEIRGFRSEDVSDPQIISFFEISFTHHMLILNKCKTIEERFFYIHSSSSMFWSVSLLEHHIDARLFYTQGKLPNNFEKTLPEQMKPSALVLYFARRKTIPLWICSQNYRQGHGCGDLPYFQRGSKGDERHPPRPCRVGKTFVILLRRRHHFHRLSGQ